MIKKQFEYQKHIIDIADYIFANPIKSMSVVASDLVSKYDRSDRTIWRWITKAREYNRTRIAKQERAKDDVLTEHAKKEAIHIINKAKKEAEEIVFSRNEELSILASIARGNARKLPTRYEFDMETKETIPVEWSLEYPNDAARVAAVRAAAAIQGHEAAKKIDMDVGQKPPTKVVIEFVDFSKR
jgi:hypothetical protein